MDRLVVVSGAHGALGRAYVEYFSAQLHTRCITLTRTGAGENEIEIGDLLNAKSVADGVERISLSEISSVVLIHPVGKFKFEETGEPEIDRDGDGIDDEVFVSNVATFEHIVKPLQTLIERSERRIPLTLCAFGSVSDAYDIKYWRSYSRSKRALRDTMHTLADQGAGFINSIFIEVSTVNTEKERKLRPFADNVYWLAPQEIVARSVRRIEKARGWNKISIYKPMPGFNTRYYSDLDSVREKWSKEMGKELC
ncbi:MAG TPA: hypothetical protein VF439_02470 [Candidatus Paceibacterota bacterium]